MRHQVRWAALSLLTFAGVSFAISPTSEPIHDGLRATCDLPVSQHIQNVGGSDGSGLCVFTSAEHSARWQNIRELDGFQNWMRKRPGGGWPEKLDQMIVEYCRAKGAAAPLYIQHTGGDESFLDLAVKTDRMPCVTYAGRDDFYRGRIAHMVNLAHLDASRAAIIDNNRPGVWVWMTRAEFLSRWRDMNGGWAVVFFAPPPPPSAERASGVFGAAPCLCGDSCKCAAGDCPSKCPVVVGQCQGPNCPVPLRTKPAIAEPATTGPAPIGTAPGPDYEWGEIPGAGWGWRFKTESPANPVLVEQSLENYGVDMSRVHDGPRYSINGIEVNGDEARRALLSDDSDRWHVTAVGEPEFLAGVKADIDRIPAAARARMLVQLYRPTDWPVQAFKLPTAGVNLRRPSPGRVSADVGTIPASEYTAAKLAALLTITDPNAPKPKPEPEPGPVIKPLPAPAPAPAPDNAINPWLAIVVAGIALLFSLFRKQV